MRKWFEFMLAILIFLTVHEAFHALISAFYSEFEGFHWSIFPQVIFVTPVEERIGLRWAFISGTSNIVTLLLGYLLLVFGQRIARLHSVFLKASIYYLTLMLLLIDAFNLSIGPFIYGGDANGIAVGLGISRYLVQTVFFLILLVNRELLAQKLLPLYDVKTDHPLLRPWIRL